MSEWVPIEESISLEGLLERWKGVEIDGKQLDFQAIDNFVRGCEITAYDRKDWIIRHGHREWRGQRRPPMLGLNGSDPFAPGHDIIFDQEEIDSIERTMFSAEPLSPSPQLAAAQGRIAELEQELAAAQEAQKNTAMPATTVTAAKWEKSVSAAFDLWADIIAGDKADWKADEFRTALASRCNDYHTKVVEIAWRLLPKVFKAGTGRPKKNPENPQQSDIT